MSDHQHSPVLENKAFRDALGQFATGVAVVTALTESGEKIGMTVNSFASVSLDPALVLWSIDKNALSYDAFLAAKHYAIQILGDDQQDTSNLFASRGEDKFANVGNHTGLNNVPLLDDYAALFECEIEHQYEGGDHVILVGKVLSFDNNNKSPLLFHAGNYATKA